MRGMLVTFGTVASAFGSKISPAARIDAVSRRERILETNRIVEQAVKI
jgi:hypothetical protein